MLVQLVKARHRTDCTTRSRSFDEVASTNLISDGFVTGGRSMRGTCFMRFEASSNVMSKSTSVFSDAPDDPASVFFVAELF